MGGAEGERRAVPTSPLGLLVEDYLAACRARGLSPKTIRMAYGYPLRGTFLPWCASEGITQVERLTTRELERYATELLDRGGKRGPLSKHTVWSYMKAVRSFVSWARTEGQRVDAQVKLPRLPQRVIEVLSREEVQRLEDATDSERDKLIVRLLADTGIRVGELVNLRDQDLVDRDRSLYLKVRGKGDRERLVPLSPALARRLRRYIDRSRPADAQPDRIFISRRRSPNGSHDPLTESGVQQLVRDLGERVGLRKRVHPHLFRHSAATYMLQRGMNPLLVAQILGHTSLAMIQRVYSHLTPTDAHRALMEVLRGD